MAVQTTKKDTIYKMLKDAGENGIQIKAAKKAVSTTDSGIFSIVHDLRKRGIHIELDSESMTYVYRGETPGESQNPYSTKKKRKTLSRSPSRPLPVPETGNSGGIISAKPVAVDSYRTTSNYKALVKKAADLAPEDRNDFFDMLTKSIFYQMSARAIVEANDLVDSMRKEAASEG